MTWRHTSRLYPKSFTKATKLATLLNKLVEGLRRPTAQKLIKGQVSVIRGTRGSRTRGVTENCPNHSHAAPQSRPLRRNGKSRRFALPSGLLSLFGVVRRRLALERPLRARLHAHGEDALIHHPADHGNGERSSRSSDFAFTSVAATSAGFDPRCRTGRIAHRKKRSRPGRPSRVP